MWRTLTSNWSMKLLALALAVLVWMYAKGVVIKRTEAKTYFEVDSPSTVDVTVRPEHRRVKLHLSGPAAAIAEMSGRHIQILHKVRDVEDLATDREDSVPLDQTMVANLPGQVQVHVMLLLTGTCLMILLPSYSRRLTLGKLGKISAGTYQIRLMSGWSKRIPGILM